MVMDLEFKKIDELDLLFLNNLRNQCAPEYLHDDRTFTDYETIVWFNKTKPDYHIILYKGEKIGYFRISSHSTINRNLYLGADLLPEYRGKGLAKRSYQLFIPILFERYDLHKINLEVLSTNINALQLYKSLGFKKDGIKRQEVFKKDKWVDSIMMSLLKEEYENWG
jgi:RimJ/RimL family protein N-acetyltransferase